MIHPLVPSRPRARFIVCAATCLAALLSPARSFATRWIIDQSGAGDFTTIQAALDQQWIELRDSILVMPGDYPESLVATQQPWYDTGVRVVGVLGAAVTKVKSLTVPGDGWLYMGVEGLTFVDGVSISYDWPTFKRCVFGGPVNANGGGGGNANIEDCDFYGRTLIQGYLGYPGSYNGWGPFTNLRFHGAPLEVRLDGSGWGAFKDCTFEGPADTLVYSVSNSDPIWYENCRFTNAINGIVYSGGSFGIHESVSRCQFEDLSEAGIRHESESSYWPITGIVISASRFLRCGTAVRWVVSGGAGSRGIQLVADTILSSTHEGVVIGRDEGGFIFNTIVDGSGSHGIAFLQNSEDGAPAWSAAIGGSTITNNAGDGIFIQGSSVLDAYGRPSFSRCDVADCLLVGNRGAGLRATGGQWKVRDCVAFANGSSGFIANSLIALESSQLLSNTSALNQGDGFRLTGPAFPGDSLKLVQHNLAVLNTGAGFRVPHLSTGSFAFNDAWSNYQGQYGGAWGSADSNLTVDPRFCDLGAGNLGLQQGSPAGAGGIYGLIGALPEQCPNTTAVEPAVPRLSFAVHPTVARGSVEFVPPSSGPDGRVEIFDVSGRRHWSAVFGPTTGSLRWTGQSDNGHAQPGLYWVRFTRAGETQSQRLVWLR